MVPTLTSPGTSFKGAGAYYLHDKDASTRGRVAWTHTENLLTDDPEKALKVMAFTALHQAELKAAAGVKATGRKLEKPVFAFSLAWHPEQGPDRAHMLTAAREAVAVLGLAGHEALYVAHSDMPHPHVHVIVNRVHPQTGKAATLSRSRRRIQEWARGYQRQRGESYCPARNARARAAGSRAHDPAMQRAWERSDSGRAFAAALAAEGYTLARGYKRTVAVDRWGKVHNPARLIDGVTAQAFRARLRDLDLARLPSAVAVQKAVKGRRRRHEEWAARTINRTQDRIREERHVLKVRHEERIAAKREELARHYRTEQVCAEIVALRQETQRRSLLRTITGKAGRDQERLDALERELEDIEARNAEQIGALEARTRQESARQEQQHERERERMREQIARREAEACRAQGWQQFRQADQALPEQTRTRERGRER